MESISHPLPKRRGTSFPSNGGACSSHNSVYDDVFGGPPKFGLPTLAPRLQDYAEIFGGFHTSRSSSIPVLDLPLLSDHSDLHFDVRNPGFNYAEVFGDFRGLDSAALFEDLVGQSSGGYEYDSSFSDNDEWSPAQSGSLSDGLYPSAGHDTGQTMSDGSGHQSLESTKEFNVSYNKSSERIMETVFTGTSSVTKFDAFPGYTCYDNEDPVPWKDVDDYCTLHAAEDIHCKRDFGGIVTEEKRYEKSSCANNMNTAAKHGTSTSPPDNKPFVTVSDISLRTKPSHLPPPSRPPPAFTVRKGERKRSDSKLKSFASERVLEDSPPLFFDVVLDSTSSADSVRDNSHKESIDRKRDVQNQLHLEDDDVQVEEKRNKTASVTHSFYGDRILHRNESTGSAPSTEDLFRSRKCDKEILESQGGQYCNYNIDHSAGNVAWMEGTEYIEVIDKNILKEAFEVIEDYNALTPQINADAFRHLTTDSEASDQEQDGKKFKVTKEAPTWDEERNVPATDKCELGNKQQSKKPNTRLRDEKEFEDKVKPNSKVACAYDSFDVIRNNVQPSGETATIPQVGYAEIVEGPTEAKCHVDGLETKPKLKTTPKVIEIEKSSIDIRPERENNVKHKENIVRKECQRQLEEVHVGEDGKERTEHGGIGKQNELYGKENENKLAQAHALRKNETALKECNIHGEIGQKSFIAVGDEKRGHEGGIHKEKLTKEARRKVNELVDRRELELDENDILEKLASEWEMQERNENAPARQDSDVRLRKADTEAGNKKENFERINGRIGKQELSGDAEENLPFKKNGHEREVQRDLESHVHEEDQFKVFDGACKLNKMNGTIFAGKLDYETPEATQAPFSCGENSELKTQPNRSAHESDSGLDDPLLKGKLRFSQNEDKLQGGNDTAESHSLPKQTTDSNLCGTGSRFASIRPEKGTPAMVHSDSQDKLSTEDDWGQKMKGTKGVFRESHVDQRKVEDASSGLKQNEDLLNSRRKATEQRCERKDKNTEDDISKDQKVRERMRTETELENEHIRKLEEEREREREREKDRMAVDKAALEARERSCAETREKAERSAVERATAEVRQRALAEARERLEKASMEARIRAERAAVERATAEARQRAAEKLMAEKAAFGARERVERPISDSFSASSRFGDARQSFYLSDQFQNTGFVNGLRHPYSSVNVGVERESPQRSKARLERYRRTAERAANALAEKNKRDLLAQREREERNRVAEVLDAEVKRWSSGKEGNLRALLSTLQYILGPESGWQPVPLTEVITSAAVKRAYRRATLYVHPDKLQQRGATVQQKYICEKVFDLLKEAWSKFNSEER